MQAVRRYRLPALFCALAVLLCELIARPYANTGICDDGPYILMARTLATTGHIVYNGGEAALILFQLYLSMIFIKLFGFSLTSVRMSTLFVAVVLAFLLQRTFIRTGITERNATIGTLALVLSPLYLLLSVTFMSDIAGLFAIVLCLHSCLRVLQAASDRAAVGWICFAVISNLICGTSRQIALLGTLVMVPSTVWLLRHRGWVLVSGLAAIAAGLASILACVNWLSQQPYTIPIPLFVSKFPVIRAISQLFLLFLDTPFLLLPIFMLFLPQVHKGRPRSLWLSFAAVLVYILLAIRFRHVVRMLEPTNGNSGGWIGTHGVFDGVGIRQGVPPFLPVWVQAILTVICLSALVGLLFAMVRAQPVRVAPAQHRTPSWAQFALLIVPFATAYSLLLLANAGTTYTLYDRYALGILVAVLPCLVRFYQEQIDSRMPNAVLVVICTMAIYGIAVTHNTFALERARVTINAEIAARGVPDTAVDNGWDYNFDVELQHSSHINDPRIRVPANAYVPVSTHPPGLCDVFWYDRTPHIKPLYSVSSDPQACDGPAPFAPVHYSRWLSPAPGTLYVVRYAVPATN